MEISRISPLFIINCEVALELKADVCRGVVRSQGEWRCIGWYAGLFFDGRLDEPWLSLSKIG
jgi:hypothetical protein